MMVRGRLLWALLPLAARAPGPGMTPCWYCGPTCFVECTWSVYEPRIYDWAPQALVSPGFEPCGHPEGVCVVQPPLVIGPNEELAVQSEKYLLTSSDGGRSWDREGPAPTGPTHCPWATCTSFRMGAGLGWLRDGTVLAVSSMAGPEQQLLWVSRGRRRSPPSTNKSQAWVWEPAVLLPPAWRNDSTGGDNAMRCLEASDGTVYFITEDDDAKPPAESEAQAIIYASTDKGRSFAPRGSLGMWTSESDVLERQSQPGHLVGVTRLQTKNSSDSPANNSPMGQAIGPRYQATALVTSRDAGRTWSAMSLLTAEAQQTAAIVELGDGTLICVFSHKDYALNPKTATMESYGQRFIVSYDGGSTWSNRIFDLNHGGASVPKASCALR